MNYKQSLIVWASACVMTLMSCGGQNGQANNTGKNHEVKKMEYADLNREWMITELGTFPKDSLVHYRASLQLPNEQTLHASLGCNQINYGVQLHLDKKQMITQQAAMTKMLCEGTADSMERYFVEQMSQKKIDIIIDGHNLILSSDNKQILSAIAADWD